MRRVRVIPVLLIQDRGLVKSVQFKKHKYVGDPINAVKIFNEKEVDELVILDISATSENRPPNISEIQDIASEAFMPLAYGGGISNLEQVKQIFFAGIEKVVINTRAIDNPKLIRSAAEQFGSQSIIVSIDVKKNWRGKYQVFSHVGRKKVKIDPVRFAIQMEELGAGEIFLNSVDRDGTFQSYDLDLIRSVADAINIPLICCGGASSVDDFMSAIQQGKASAVAAGSMFVFNGPHKAVLISYPQQDILKENLFNRL